MDNPEEGPPSAPQLGDDTAEDQFGAPPETGDTSEPPATTEGEESPGMTAFEEISTTDAEGETKHFTSEETSPDTAQVTTAESEPQPDLPPEVEPEAPPEEAPVVDDQLLAETVTGDEEDVETWTSQFQVDEMEGEGAEEDQVYPYTPSYEFPPESEPVIDELLNRYLSQEIPGEIDMEDENEELGMNVKDLDEMIRLLQGEVEEDATAEACGRRDMLVSLSGGNTLDEGQQEAREDESGPRDQGKETDEDQLVVLGPDHPKMRRFQEALKQHLERQLYQTDCETRDAENELKVLRREREETGQHLYNLQFELVRQTDYLAKLEGQLENLAKQRVKLEEAGQVIEGELKQAKAELRKEIDVEEETIRAMKEMDMMEWCIRQTDQEYEGEAKIQGHLDEQFRRIKTKTEVDKKSQDFYLDKLMGHIQRMEQANAGIQRQIQAHLEEQKDLNTSILEASTEIEVLQIEKHHLSNAWNETITVVRARDEALNGARQTLQQAKEEVRLKESELRGMIRGIRKEQEKHEQMTVLLKRRKMEERIAESQLKALQVHTADLQEKLNILFTIKHQVEIDYARAVSSLKRKEREIFGPRRSLEVLSAEKAKLEDMILLHMQEHQAMDKVSMGLAKRIKEARDKTRKIEENAVKVENEMTRVSITVEKLKTELLKKSSALEELDKKVKAQEKVLEAQEADMKMSDRLIQKKTGEIEALNRKLQKMIDANGGVETSGLEKEIDFLEKQVTAARNYCVDLQEQWLKLQTELVSLVKQRDEIWSENELIQKEGFILERKKDRLSVEVEEKKLAAEKVHRKIGALQREIATFNTKLYQGKEEECQMNRDNVLIQNEFVALLKEAETEAIELQQEIANLEEEKETLTASLQEGHEKCLWWEKKVKLAKELRDSIKQEQETSTSGLKLAIHHMQVRYQELMKVQEKLMTDLDRSIDKRDQIIIRADNDLKRANVNPNKTKLAIQRNRESIEEKNRKVVKEAIEAEKEVKDMEEQIKTLEVKLKCESEALTRIREMIIAADDKINEATVDKHKDMIDLFLRQEKHRVLEALSMNRYKPPHTQEEIDQLTKQSEELCYELAELCEILTNQYPDLALPIKLIRASMFTGTK